MNERIHNLEDKCIKCGKMYSEHPTTGRFNTVILFGNECAWNPDNEFEGFVKSTLKSSGYDLLDFGYENESVQKFLGQQNLLKIDLAAITECYYNG